MLADLYNNGIIGLSTLSISFTLLLVVIFFSFIAYKTGIIVGICGFSAAIVFILTVCLMLPPSWWLYAVSSFILFQFFCGFVFALIVGLSGASRYTCEYSHLSNAFAGSNGILLLSYKPSLKFAFITGKIQFHLEGSDSSYISFQPIKEKLGFCRGSSCTIQLEASFIMRGYDRKSFLYALVEPAFPFSIAVLWKKRVKIMLPEMHVLSSSFAFFEGKKIPSSESENRRTPVRRISKMRTENFLHLSKYSPGESVSRIDFKATMRSNDIISKKYSKSVDLRSLTAMGFGRRVVASGVCEGLLSEFGKMIAENFSTGICTDAAVFDMVKRHEYNLSLNPHSAIKKARDLSSVMPSVHEEDEFCLSDGLGMRIRDYTHVRILTAWGGSFDCSRAIEAASVFVKNGADAEIRIYAPGVLSVIDQNPESSASDFFKKLMNEYYDKGRRCGVIISWFC